jgi:hypothetical protein
VGGNGRGRWPALATGVRMAGVEVFPRAQRAARTLINCFDSGLGVDKIGLGVL